MVTSLSDLIVTDREADAQREGPPACEVAAAPFCTPFGNSADAIILVSDQGVIESFNAAAEQIFGYCAAEMIGHNAKLLLIWPSREECSGDGQTAPGCPHPPRDLFGRHRSGRAFPLELSVTKLDVGGRVFFLAVARDLTQRQQAEAERAERIRLAELMADVNMCLTQATAMGSMLERCGELLIRHLGGAFVHIWTTIGRGNVLELQASAGRNSYLEEGHTRVPVGQFEIGLIASERKPLLTNDVIADPRLGDQAWARREGMVSFAGHPLLVEGRLVGVMALFARDRLGEATQRGLAAVADSIALGIERWRAEEALRSAHAENDRILETIPSILISLDGNNRIMRCNPAAEQAFAIRAANIRGRPFELAGIRWVDDRVEKAVEVCRQDRTVTRLDDVPFHRADRTRGYLGLSLTPINDTPDDPPGILLLAADVTERRRLEAQLVQAQKLESIGQLAAGVAHEINTPIQYIGDNTAFLRDAFTDLCAVLPGYDRLLASARAGIVPAELVQEVEALATRADVEYLSTEVPRALEQTLEGVDSVARIVRALKEFSHPGGQDRAPIDINHAIGNTLTVARNEWKYVAEVVTDFDTTLPPVPCLPGEFNQVILNLVVNAAHAIAETGAGGDAGRGTITVSTRRLGDHAEVCIADTGCGIPEAIRSRVFDPFFTTKPVGKGTGQGLAIAHDVVVKKHGGTISLDSELGKGTTFRILLPLSAQAVAGETSRLVG